MDPPVMMVSSDMEWLARDPSEGIGSVAGSFLSPPKRTHLEVHSVKSMKALH